MNSSYASLSKPCQWLKSAVPSVQRFVSNLTDRVPAGTTNAPLFAGSPGGNVP